MPHTFASLSKMSNDELETVLKTSPEPPLTDDIVGWEFEGWNVNPGARIIGSRKFKKGFFGNPEIYGDPDRGYAWGYNMTVEQNAFDEPWIPTPSPADPTRRFFFGVVPGAKANRPKYPETLVIDYRLWKEYFPLNPVGYTVDYLVYPNPGDPTLALGKSYFEAGPLTPFLGYFLLRRDPRRSGYPRQSHFLTEPQLATVKAFAEIFLPQTAVLSPEEVMWNIDRQLERVRSKRSQSLRLILFLLEHVLPLQGFNPAFSKMAPAKRRAFVDKRLAKATARDLRNLAKIRALFAAGYYGDHRVYPSIGFERVEQRPRYDAGVYAPIPQPAVNVRRDPAETVECEVCVIGSGAGGAVVAGTLAERGKHVVLLEEGAHIATAQVTDDEGRMIAATYKEGGLQTTVDFDMVLLQGQCLGGTTVINNAICFPVRDDVLDEWRDLGADLDRNALRASFARMEQEIQAAAYPQYAEPALTDIGGENPKRLLDGWTRRAGTQAGGREHGMFVKNKNRCLGCGYCNFGCRFGRKLSMLETYVPKLQGPRAYVIDRCHAVKIERKGRRATAVVCEHRGGKTIRVTADTIVVACGAIGSSVLLMKSGIAVKHRGKDLVGSRFSFNAGTPMFGLFPQPVRAFDGMQMGGYVNSTDGGSTGPFLLESHFDPPMSFAASLPGWFETHFDRMRRYPHWASAGVLIRTRPDARVKTSAFERDTFGPVEWKDIAPEDLEKLITGMAEVAANWFAAGADLVLPATFLELGLDRPTYGAATPEAIAEVLRGKITKKDDLTLSSAHLQGGNPLSDDDAIGVVDSQFRVKPLDNLYVCDASVFPSSVGVNPQLTIMAMADYFTRVGAV